MSNASKSSDRANLLLAEQKADQPFRNEWVVWPEVEVQLETKENRVAGGG